MRTVAMVPRGRSIASVPPRRHDGGEFIEIQIVACKAAAVGVSRRLSGKAVVPGGVFGLQGEEPGDRVERCERVRRHCQTNFSGRLRLW